MSRLPESCQFFMAPGLRCGRVPVVADYVSVSDVEGERLITSNCSLHDMAAARRFAMAKGFVRRSRNVARALTEEELLYAYSGTEA